MSYIFISYSHDDEEYAHRLEKALVKKGFKVWLDDRIDFGTEWPRVIQERLDSCKILILIMSPSSSKSIWVQNELSRAQRKRKIIYPLLLKGEEQWLQVETVQYIDVRDASLPPERFYEILTKHFPKMNDISLAKINQKDLINEIVTALKEYHKISKAKYKGESDHLLYIGNIILTISIIYPYIPRDLNWKSNTSRKLDLRPISLEVPVKKKVEHPPNSQCTINAMIYIYKDRPMPRNKKQKLINMQWVVDELAVKYLKINNVISYLSREWKSDQGIEFSLTLMENIAKDLIAANKVLLGKNSEIEVVLSRIKKNE